MEMATTPPPDYSNVLRNACDSCQLIVTLASTSGVATAPANVEATLGWAESPSLETSEAEECVADNGE